MANFSIDNFKSEVFSRGLAKRNRFEVELPSIPGWEDVYRLSSLFCEIAAFPPLSIINRGLKIQGPIYQRGTSVDYGGTILLTFLVDRDMLIRKFFEVWSTLIIEPATFNVGYHSDYVRNIILRQLDDKEQLTYQLSLIDAYPSAIGQMDLNQSEQSSFHRLNISFSYRYWESDYIKNASYYRPEISGPTESLVSLEPTIKGKPITEKQQPKTIPRVSTETLPGGTAIVGPGGAVFGIQRNRR
jgi:hypothetical protein